MSDSVRPHRWQPTRLPRPWDSPGKNTAVGCHFLLQCIKVKSESEVAQSYLTPSDPLDCSLPVSSVHGVFQARVLEWVAIAFSVTAIALGYFQKNRIPHRGGGGVPKTAMEPIVKSPSPWQSALLESQKYFGWRTVSTG